MLHDEIDLLVEGVGLRVVAIDVKLSSTVIDLGVRRICWLPQAIGDRLSRGCSRTPGSARQPSLGRGARRAGGRGRSVTVGRGLVR